MSAFPYAPIDSAPASPFAPRAVLAPAGEPPESDHVMLLYRMAIGMARLVAPLLSGGDSKLARGLAGRRGAVDVLEAWGRALRDPRRPVLWFHAPSVGEGLQAEAVIQAVRERRPEVQVIFTFFSPSAEPLARRMDVDVATYLPWDLRGPVGRVLDACRPSAVVFTKTEVWPVVVGEAAARAIPCGIVAASVPDGAGRRRWVARALLRRTWGTLAFACANTAEDVDALVALGVRADALERCGDPGIDSAVRRFDARDRSAPWLTPFRGSPRPTLVAGSTWPADEAVLLPALDEVRRAYPDLRVIVAPHEPSEGAVGALLRSFSEGGWSTATLAEVESGAPADAVVVERVGVLAELYEAATVSFVGGGFHDAGLHSVLEPAAAGSPVVFGPAHDNARAAHDLLDSGGAKVASDVEGLATVVKRWLSDETVRRAAGDSAADYIQRHRGAAARTAMVLDPLLRHHE